jgi:hypothetical protein
VAIIREMLLYCCSVGSIMYCTASCIAVRLVASCAVQQSRNVLVKSLCGCSVALWRTTIETCFCKVVVSSHHSFYSTHWRSEDDLIWECYFYLFRVRHCLVWECDFWWVRAWTGQTVQGLHCARAYCCKMPNISVHVRQKIPITACNEMPCAVC